MSNGSKGIIKRTEAMVSERLEGNSSGHDWWHIDRVRRAAIEIARTEKGADMIVVELAALLHDISDWKFNGGDDKAGVGLAREWLISQRLGAGVVRAVCDAIADVTFKGKAVRTKPSSLEGCIVQDADRLDAIGAIGVARAFAYGGSTGRDMYIPGEGPREHPTFEDYRKDRGHTINHFHEKLLLLKDRLNTERGRKIAEGRHGFMLEFLDRFQMEWEGKA